MSFKDDEDDETVNLQINTIAQYTIPVNDGCLIFNSSGIFLVKNGNIVKNFGNISEINDNDKECLKNLLESVS